MFQVLKYKLNPFWTLVYKQHYLVNSPYKITYTGKFKEIDDDFKTVHSIVQVLHRRLNIRSIWVR